MGNRLGKVGIVGLLEVVEGCLDLASVRERTILTLSEEIQNLKVVYNKAVGQLQRPEKVATDFTHRKGVLIVDNNNLARLQLRDLFRLHGIGVFAVARNGAEAIELYRLHRPAVVTMEMEMPVMNGYETALQIKRIDPYANIIFVSHVVDRKQVVKAKQCGAVDCVAKPVDTARLVDLVNKLLTEVIEEGGLLQ
jgi:two-component system chemotaxis response regulator CheY